MVLFPFTNSPLTPHCPRKFSRGKYLSDKVVDACSLYFSVWPDFDRVSVNDMTWELFLLRSLEYENEWTVLYSAFTLDFEHHSTGLKRIVGS